MTPNISAMAVEIADAQTVVSRLTNRKNTASAIYANAISQRPAGIDPAWLPDFTISAGTAHVWAWFDPVFYGNQLNRS